MADAEAEQVGCSAEGGEQVGVALTAPVLQHVPGEGAKQLVEDERWEAGPHPVKGIDAVAHLVVVVVVVCLRVRSSKSGERGNECESEGESTTLRYGIFMSNGCSVGGVVGE